MLRAAADVVEKQLFSTVVVEVKARRVVAPRCPECHRRGYCVKVCRRRSLRAGAPLVDELALRWVYLARVLWSHGIERELARLHGPVRAAPQKGAAMHAT